MIHGLLKAMQWSVLAIVLYLLLALITASGCQRLQKTGRHLESGWEGLDRTITLYTDEGRVLHRWHAKTYIETDPPVVAFLDSAGVEVKLSGGIVVVQERR